MSKLILFNSSEWPPAEGGKRLNGKYLQLLESFADSLILHPDEFLLDPTPEYDALVSGMSKVFFEHLTPENVESIIFRQCMYFEAENPGRVAALSAPENKELRDSLVSRLKSFFESIPRRCSLRIELPSLSVQPGLTPLAPDVNLIGPIRAAETNLLRPDPEPFVALEISVDGFGDHTADSPAVSTALSIAKQFAFVMNAFNIVRVSYTDKVAESSFRDSENSWYSQITLPEGVRRSFSRIKLNENKLVFHEWMKADSKTVLGLLRFADAGRAPSGELEEKLAQDYLLNDVRRFFSARADEDFEQIAAAIEWYQDSLWAENDTFAYIAACIGLEAVLGSSDEQLDSLSKRLADRYAFLMGKGRKEREALRTAYSDVLKLRGRLVHGKAARLDPKERPLLKKVQDLLLQLLWKEIHRIRPAA
jgi:hypothetical protein